MLTLLKCLFASDETPVARPACVHPRLGGNGISLEAREVPSITPAQMAAVQVTPGNTVVALAAVPVNQATADAVVKDARTVLTAISLHTNPADVQNRATINQRLTAVSIEKSQYDAARTNLQTMITAFGAQNASIQLSLQRLVPDSMLAQQRTTVANLTARLTAEAGELKAATRMLRTAAVTYMGPAISSTDPLALRVAAQANQATTDLLRNGTAWQMADQMVTMGVARHRQILSQVSQLEVQRTILMSNVFSMSQGAAVQNMIFNLQQQADRLGTNLVLAQQAMTRQYEAWYGLQTAVERARDTSTATSVTELARRESDLITLRARLAAATPLLQAIVAEVAASL